MERKIRKKISGIKEELIDNLNNTKVAYFDAIKAVETKDYDLGKQVIKNDKEINQLESEIDNKCMILLATLAPKATDLRRIISYMKINSYIERVADYGKKIGGMITRNNVNRVAGHFDKIKEMSLKIVNMINLSIEAIKSEKIEVAFSLSQFDKEVDDIYDEIIKDVKKSNKKEASDELLHVILLVRHLERAGDNLVSLAKEIIFIQKGKKISL